VSLIDALIAFNQPVISVPKITLWFCMTFTVLITPRGIRRNFDKPHPRQLQLQFWRLYSVVINHLYHLHLLSISYS